ncbi:MAG: glycosyltransferase [Planctomycetota bacterium]
MRIIYASASLIPSEFANSVHVMKMCQALAKIGHDVTLLAFRGNSPLMVSKRNIFNYYGVDPCFGIRRPCAFTGKGRSLLFALPSIRHINKENPDLIYARNLFTASLSVMLGYQTIYETHTEDEEGGDIGRALLCRMMKSSNFVRLVVISDALEKVLKNRLPEEKILVASDGADLMTRDIRHVEADPLVRRGETVRVGYVGHLYHGRGIDIICRLAALFEDVDFHIVGGFDKDVEYWKTKAPEGNVHFYGFVPPRQIPRYLSACDILVMPYKRNVSTPGGKDTSKWMSPMKMFEYMSAGKAIISSNHRVLKEVLRHEVNALLVAPDHIEEWQLALQRLIDEPEFRKSLGKQALNNLKANYTWEKRADRVLEGIVLGNTV